MQNNLLDIDPGEGLGVLKFGMTRNEVRQILGEPEYIDSYAYRRDGTDLSERWDYDDDGLWLSFDEEDNWRLIHISVSSDKFLLNGKSLIGKNHKIVIAELDKLNLGQIETEDSSIFENPNNLLVNIDSQSMSFYFGNDILDDIQWGPLFIDDDTIKWPT